MNTLAYSTQKPEEVAIKVEDIIKKDLGVNDALKYEIIDTGEINKGLGGFLQDGLSLIVGGEEVPLFAVKFSLTVPRTVEIICTMVRQGVGCHCGTIAFTTMLNKTVSGTVTFEEPKVFGSSKFIGDKTISDKLNNNKELLKLTDKLARIKAITGGVNVKMKRYVKLEPEDNKTKLTIITLPRAVSMGFGVTTDAKDFFTIADMIEKAL